MCGNTLIQQTVKLGSRSYDFVESDVSYTTNVSHIVNVIFFLRCKDNNKISDFGTAASVIFAAVGVCGLQVVSGCRFFCIFGQNIAFMRFCHLFVSALALFVMLACTSRGGKKVAASSATAATLPPGCIDLSGGYGADTASSAFYYRGRLMVVSDAGSFRVLADGYAADDSSGYFEGRPFRAQFPHTLAAVGGGYAKDRSTSTSRA